MYTYPFSPNPPLRLPHDIEQSSVIAIYAPVGTCWFSILNIASTALFKHTCVLRKQWNKGNWSGRGSEMPSVSSLGSPTSFTFTRAQFFHCLWINLPLHSYQTFSLKVRDTPTCLQQKANGRTGNVITAAVRKGNKSHPLGFFCTFFRRHRRGHLVPLTKTSPEKMWARECLAQVGREFESASDKLLTEPALDKMGAL